MNSTSETSEITSVFHIPGKQEVFQALVSGMHISLYTGELYHFLQERFTDYEAEFKTLGYSLIHEQDYYYLQVQDDNKPNDFSRRSLVFIAIMLESIANEAGDVVETFFNPTGFERDQLPHFSTERYRNYMQHLNVSDEKQLNTVLKSMHRTGFIDYRDAENYVRFLSPCHRFLQISLEILEQHKKDKMETTP